MADDMAKKRRKSARKLVIACRDCSAEVEAKRRSRIFCDYCARERLRRQRHEWRHSPKGRVWRVRERERIRRRRATDPEFRERKIRELREWRRRNRGPVIARCIICNAEFAKRGPAVTCGAKECRKERRRQHKRLDYVRHAEQQRQKSRRYAAKHKEAQQDYHRAYYRKNRERIRAQQRANTDRIAALMRRWRAANREHRKDYKRRRETQATAVMEIFFGTKPRAPNPNRSEEFRARDRESARKRALRDCEVISERVRRRRQLRTAALTAAREMGLIEAKQKE